MMTQKKRHSQKNEEHIFCKPLLNSHQKPGIVRTIFNQETCFKNCFMQLTQNMKEMLQELQSHAKHTYLEVSA